MNQSPNKPVAAFHLSCALVALTLLFASMPALARDLSVLIPSSIVKKTLEDKITEYLQTHPISKLGWSSVAAPNFVEAYPNGNNGLKLHIKLKMGYTLNQSKIYLFDADLDLLFACTATDFAITVTGLSITTLGTAPDATTRKAIQDQVNAMIAAQAAPITTQLRGLLDSVATEVGSSPLCPHVEFRTDGAIYADVDFTSGCINGRTYTRRCGAGYYGAGSLYLCVNGYWVLQERDCEPGLR